MPWKISQRNKYEKRSEEQRRLDPIEEDISFYDKTGCGFSQPSIPFMLSKDDLLRSWDIYVSDKSDIPVKEKDLTGMTLGRWHVVGRAPDRIRKRTWGKNSITGDGLTAYYLCHCACGTWREVQATPLRTGRSASCGCIKRQLRRTGFGESAKKQLVGVYKNSAKSRGLEWCLTEEEVISLASKPCHYCSIPSSSTFKPTRGYGNFDYNGIDRKDNSKGYVHGNVVTCCIICNQGKMARSYEEFTAWVKGFKERTINEYISKRDQSN